MSVTRRLWRSVWFVGLVTAVTSGCASVKSSVPRVPDISQKRQERTRAAARRFDQKRDLAEFEAARASWLQGDSDGSTEALKRLLARNPDHIETRLLMAELLLSDNRQSEAIAYLEPATTAHPNDARVQHMMGLLLDSIGQTDEALAYYEQAKRLRPNDELYAVSYQTLSASDEESNRPPDSPMVPLSPGCHSAAVDPNASCPNLLPVPGQESADSASQPMALAGGPASSHSDGREPNAIEIAEDPGRFATHEGDPGARRWSFEPADPPTGQSGAWVELVVRDRGTADGAEATGSIERHDPADDLIADPASEWLDKGLSLMSEGMGALALAYFQDAMALKPDDPQIPISAAVSALQHNQPDVAVVLLEPLLETFPDSAAIRRILGAAHYRLGDYESSQVALRQALSLDKSSALSYFLMGCTLVKLGRQAAAETQFRQAGRLDPKYALRR